MSLGLNLLTTIFVRDFARSFHSTARELFYRKCEVRRFLKDEILKITDENSPWKNFPFEIQGNFPTALCLTAPFSFPEVSRVGGEGGGGRVLMRYWENPGKDVSKQRFVSRWGRVVIRSATFW